jgi:hypothetical protein
MIDEIPIVLLQAAIGAGMLLFILFPLFLLLGISRLTGIFMKFIWRKRKKEEFLKNKVPYYKDPLWFFLSLLLSVLILGYLFYALLILFDIITPEWGYSN